MKTPGKDWPFLLVLAILALALAIIVLLSGPSDLAAAAAPPGFEFALKPTGERSWFDFQAEPGETISDTLLIANYSSEPVALHIFRAAAHTTADGNWNLLRQDGAAQWIGWDDRIFEIGPASGEQVDFSLTVPPGTPTGEYFAGLVAEPSEWKPPLGGGGVVINVMPIAGVAIRITVGEPSDCAVAIDSAILERPDLLVLNMRNQGNTRFRGSGEVEIEGASNTFSTALGLRYFVAGDSVAYFVNLPMRLEPGGYGVRAEIHSSEWEGCSASFAGISSLASPPQPEQPVEQPAASTFDQLLRPLVAEAADQGIATDLAEIKLYLAGTCLLSAGGFLALVYLFLFVRYRRTQRARRESNYYRWAMSPSPFPAQEDDKENVRWDREN